MLRLFTTLSAHAACLRGVRFASTNVKPPMLAKLRDDMKTAMRARDKPRLNVVKGIIGDMNNLIVPLKDDVGVLSLINRKIAGLKGAAKEYDEAGRADLANQAEEELAILNEYQAMVQMMSKEEIEEYVSQAIQEIRKDGKKPLVGTVFKLLFGAEGGLRDKPVRKQDVKDVFDRLVKVRND